MSNQRLNLVLIGNDTVTVKQKKLLSGLANAKVKTISSTLDKEVLRRFLFSNAVVIYNLSMDWVEELKTLEEIEVKHAAVIAVGEPGNPNLLQSAISAGVNEFIANDDYENKLFQTIEKILHQSETKQKSASKKTIVNAIINAKGGGGASFIASNLAYIISEKTFYNTILIDLDFQFGSIGLNFDVEPKFTIIDALNEIDQLDLVSFPGYIAKYKKLGLLLPSSKEVILPGEISPASLNKLFDFVTKSYDQVIVDLPRMIDPLNSVVMERADLVTIVLQQNLAQFRDGRRLIQILNKDLDMPLHKISVVINRYDKNNKLTRDDIVNILKHEHVYQVCNDFERAASTSNLGVPLFDSGPNSRIAKDLLQLSYKLGKIEIKKKKSLFGLFSR